MTDVNGKLMTQVEVAALLGKSVATLRHWRRIGYGPTYTVVGKTPMYALAWVNAWLKESVKNEVTV